MSYHSEFVFRIDFRLVSIILRLLSITLKIILYRRLNVCGILLSGIIWVYVFGYSVSHKNIIAVLLTYNLIVSGFQFVNFVLDYIS